MTNFAVILEFPITLLLVFNVTQPVCTITKLTWVRVQSLPAFKKYFYFTPIWDDT